MFDDEFWLCDRHGFFKFLRGEERDISDLWDRMREACFGSWRRLGDVVVVRYELSCLDC